MDVVAHRRALHAIPELDRQLSETTGYVRRVLEGLSCKVFSPTEGSVCAYFDQGRETTLALRADMDALPVQEATGAPYASTHPGIMHACGHDGHTAMLLALAERLNTYPVGALPRNVLLLFQPAEETTSGARDLCRAGVLEQYHVDRIFGMHLWPGLPAGTIATRPGPMMARAGELNVIVRGKSVHISSYRQGCDALAAAAEFLRCAYDMAAAMPSEEPLVLRFGKMTSGTVRNAVSALSVLEGNLRTYRDETYDACCRGMEEIGAQIERETGCTVEVKLGISYPAVWNHAELLESVRRQLGSEAPAVLETPAMAAEDFSFYQRQVPGVFFFLGTGATPPLHAQNFDFDDAAVLPAGAAFFEKLLGLS